MSDNLSIPNGMERSEYIQQSIYRIVQNYKKYAGTFTPPISERMLCRALEDIKGISVAVEPDRKISTLDEGILMPVRGGFIIRYGTMGRNSHTFSYSKIRETICHELAHILFYDCSSSIPRLMEEPPEYLCHDVARELLLPTEIIREKFSEKIRATSDLVDIVEQLSRDFQVAPMLTVRRLTEDLSLLSDVMFTFWRYNGGRYNGYQPDPKLSSELRKILPKYWRDQVHTEAWNRVVSKVAAGNMKDLPQTLSVQGKKRNRDGLVKNLSFAIQCVPLYDRSHNLVFQDIARCQAFSTLLSVQRFDSSVTHSVIGKHSKENAEERG